ncbi:hypothetical protein EXS73_00865 [Candidatus Pacearchaeota archaeon]|nr:hypothetical protein [Candidatus Pacearchaeota archaeon]
MYSKTAIFSFIIGVVAVFGIPLMHLQGGFIIPSWPEELSLVSGVGLLLGLISLYLVKKNNLEGMWVTITGVVLNIVAILIHFYFQSSKIGLTASYV